MIRKIWNTLRYGDSRTKRFLITVMVLGLASVGLLAAAIATLSPLFWIGAVAITLVTAATAKDAKLAVIKDNSAREGMGEEELQEELEKRKEEKKQKKEEKKKKKGDKSAEEEAAEAEAREKEDEEDFGDDALTNMTEEKLKKLFVRYKVKKEHVPVIIDLCIPERVRQAPGFAWVDGGMLKMLLIEGKPRMIERPLSVLQVMEVERGIAVRAANEYVELRQTDLMKKVFTPYLPRYQKKEIGGRTVLLKNLYVLDEDIKFTSPSVNELKKLCSFRIEIPERRLQEGTISPYYKELFTSSFLWKDGILTLKEYQQEVERVLTDMASPDISYGEFEMTLSAMINSGLLPTEYRKFAYDKREARKNGGTEETKGKKKKRK